MSSSPQEDIQNLIQNYRQRLQKLKEQQALSGINTPAETLIQIEDIEAQIEALQAELEMFSAPVESQYDKAPLVYIHNWGKKPANFPKTPHLLDWSGSDMFQQHNDGTRTLPSRELWRDKLLPRLEKLPTETGGRGRIRLAGNCALSTGFAFGAVYRAKERHQIEVAQFIPGEGTEYWTSSAPVPTRVESPQFTSLTAASNLVNSSQTPTKDDGVIVVAAISGRSVTGILRNVGAYFGEANAFSQIPKGKADFQTVKGVLLLEAEAATRQKRNLMGWEVNALAKSSSYRVSDFKDELDAKTLHLFMAAPLSLAVFIGHHWNHVYKKVQCYEETHTARHYAPSCMVAVK